MFVLLIFLNFADSLYKWGEFRKAVLEYKRLLFLRKIDNSYAYYQIAKCYENLEEFKKALVYYQKYMAEKNDIALIPKYAFLYFLTGEYEKAEYLLETSPTRKSKALLAFLYLKEGKTGKAERILKHLNLEYHSAGIWTIPSYLIPGMTQILHGEFKKGILSFILTMFSGYMVFNEFKSKNYLSGIILFDVLFIRFYTGNIYNAKRSVANYNLKKLKKKYEIP